VPIRRSRKKNRKKCEKRVATNRKRCESQNVERINPDAKPNKTMKLYIYSLESNQHAATVTGETNEACERVAEETYGSNDFAWTYSPAFECSDGLIENEEAKEVEA